MIVVKVRNYIPTVISSARPLTHGLGNIAVANDSIDGSTWLWGNNQAGELGTKFKRSEPSMYYPVSVQTICQPTQTANKDTYKSIAHGPYTAFFNNIEYQPDIAMNGVVAVKNDGSVWTWGSDYNYQIGDLTTPSTSSPVSITGGHLFSKIASNSVHAVGLKTDGTVWCWGQNRDGQLGDGTNINRSSPVSVVGNHSFIQVAVGYIYYDNNYNYQPGFSVALKADGSVWAWGNNDFGVFGNGTTDSSASPVSVTGGHSFVEISAGGAGFVAARKADGSVWCWGGNGWGQLGIGTFDAGRSTPTKVVGSDIFTQISCGYGFTIARKTDGTVVGWGFNQFGLMPSPGTNYNSPTAVNGANSFVKIVAGAHHAAGLKSDGSVWAWGNNYWSNPDDPYDTSGCGYLGTGVGYMSQFSFNIRSTPETVIGGNSFANIFAGGFCTAALKSDNSLWMWGINKLGNIGDNTTTNKTFPVTVTGGGSYNYAAIGLQHYNTQSDQRVISQSFGIRTNNTGWGWGDDRVGQLGDGLGGLRLNRSSPIMVINSGCLQAARGCGFNLVLKTNGSVVAWGSNDAGQLGTNDTNNRSLPTSVVGNHSFIKVVGGGLHSIGLKADGSVWTWGNNASGQLGDGSFINKSSPIAVLGSHSFIDVIAGFAFTAGYKADGSLWTWGSDYYGELGDGYVHSTMSGYRSSPVPVVGNFVFNKVAVGLSHSVAVRSDGRLMAWGANALYIGQLGDLTSQNKSSPILVAGNHSCVDVVAGGDFSLALKADGSAWAWGSNQSGQLGINDISPIGAVSSPVSVVGGHAFIKAACGISHAVAIKADGSAWAWGDNTFSQLADGTVTGKSSPVQVSGGHSFTQISSGYGWNVGLDGNGVAWTWGKSDRGQLGNYSLPAPALIVGNHIFTQLATGMSHSLGLKADGSAWAWGFNQDGQLGNNEGGYTASDRSSPVSVIGNHSFIQVSAGSNFSVALKVDGSVWTWGNNQSGQLGHYTLYNQPESSPVSIIGNHSFVQISAGREHVLALKADGSAWAWGRGDYGQMGSKTFIFNNSSPVSVAGGHSFIQISAGGSHSAAVKADGTIWAWGADTSGQLGFWYTQKRPFMVTGNHSFIKLSSNIGDSLVQSFTIGLKADGTAWAWGSNQNGQLGNYSSGYSDASSPVSVIGAHSFANIVNGYDFTAALKADGTIWTWGSNQAGQLGNNNSGYSGVSSPTSVVGEHNFIAVYPGMSYVTAIKADGSAWAWGWNQYGQLGDQTLTNKSSPIPVVGAHSFTSIVSGGYSYSTALKGDGSVWTWGSNTYGQLGIGTFTDVSSPTSVVGGHSFIKVLISKTHSLGLKADGSVLAWGNNQYGQIGDQVGSTRSSPTSVVGNHSFIQITAAAALKADGSVWTWGINSSGRIGNQTSQSYSSPVSVVGDHSFIQVSARTSFISALKADGSVWCWGDNNSRQLGDGTNTNRSSPVMVIGGFNFSSITNGSTFNVAINNSDNTIWSWGNASYLGDNQDSSGTQNSPVSVVGAHSFISIFSSYNYNIALKADGSAWAWGYASNGQLGINSTTQQSSPVMMVGGHLFTSIALRNYLTAGLKADGTVWMCGYNGYGCLGDNSTLARSSPVSVVGAHSFVQVAVGDYHSLAIKSDGTAWTWGYNGYGQLGQQNITNKSSPVSIIGNHSFVQVACTSYSNHGLKDDGSVWSIGNNSGGILGDQTTSSRSSPVSVVGAHSFVQICTGDGHVMALKADGSAWGWGNNTYGQLGQQTTSSRSSPVSVVGGHSFIKLVAGQYCTYGLKADNTVWTFGLNSSGQLGDGTFTNRSSPVLAVSNFIFQSVSAGDHGVGIASDGSAWAWGNNTYGQLGYFSWGNRSSPTRVAGGHTATQIAAFDTHVSFLKADGSAWCWGNGSSGQLGNQSTLFKSSPVSVVGAHSFIKIVAGDSHTAGLKADGSIWAWGYNGYGQLGDNTTTSKSSPVLVTGSHSFADIYAGWGFTAGIKGDGSVWTWGYNIYGSLGNGTYVNRSSPVSVIGNTSYVKVGPGFSYNHVLKSDGTIYGVGYYIYIGDNVGSPAHRSSPTNVVGNHSFVDIVVSSDSSYGVKADGTIWAWGYNGYGQLGNGNNSSQSSPVSVIGSGFSVLKTGLQHCVAFKSDNTAWSWGYNSDGQLGDGSTNNRSVPVSVIGDHLFNPSVSTITNGFMISAGQDGRYWGWGYDGYGQLGAENGNVRSSPIAVLSSNFISVSAGSDFTTGLKADGSVWAWGYNGYGQLGINSTNTSYSPIQVVGGHSFVQVTAHASHCVAIKATGAAWAWGYNYDSELGNGAFGFSASKSSPVAVIGNVQFSSLASGLSCHTGGLTASGVGWMWGANSHGQRGDLEALNMVSGNHSFIKVVAGFDTGVGLKADGSAWVWGGGLSSSPVAVIGGHSFANINHRYGYKSSGLIYLFSGSSAVVMITNTSFTTIQSNVMDYGNSHSVAVKADGSAWAWGNNYSVNYDPIGQLGNQNINGNASSPVTIAGSYVDVAAGLYHMITLKSDGSAWCWGSNDSGQLGLPSTASGTPQKTSGNHSYVQVGSCGYGSMAADAFGNVWTWGSATTLGNNEPAYGSSFPVIVTRNFSHTPVVFTPKFGYPLASGNGCNGHMLCVDTKTSIGWGWGTNSDWQINFNILGTPFVTIAGPEMINQMMTGISIKQAALGGSHSIIITSKGKTMCAGANASGQLGNNGYGSGTFVNVVGSHSFVMVRAGRNFSAGLKANGTAWTWGRNDARLGDGTRTDRSSPVSVIGGHSFIAITCGNDHMLGLKANGTLWSWGSNTYGQMGDGTYVNQSYPILVIGGHSFIDVVAGIDITLARKIDGSVWAWGNATLGQFGNNSLTSRNYPVQAAAGHTFIQIVIGSNHVLGLKSDGSVWAWGRNLNGQLGNLTDIGTSSPVSVIGNHSFVQISAGIATSFAVKSDGSVWGWGIDNKGQLGSFGFYDKSSPTIIGGKFFA